MFKSIAIATSLAIVSTAATSVQAQDMEIPSVRVSVAGVDANSDNGARIILQRIRAAAGQVCGGEPTPTIERVTKFNPCVKEVTQRTVAGLNNTRLTALLTQDGQPAPETKVAAAR